MAACRSIRNAYRMSDKNPRIGCQFSPAGASLQTSQDFAGLSRTA
jgi:hypothetical protein